MTNFEILNQNKLYTEEERTLLNLLCFKILFCRGSQQRTIAATLDSISCFKVVFIEFPEFIDSSVLVMIYPSILNIILLG